jgi:hypothetical protein
VEYTLTFRKEFPPTDKYSAIEEALKPVRVLRGHSDKSEQFSVEAEEAGARDPGCSDAG